MDRFFNILISLIVAGLVCYYYDIVKPFEVMVITGIFQVVGTLRQIQNDVEKSKPIVKED